MPLLRKILQSYGVSLHTMETEIQATEKFLQNYRTTGYDSAATSAVEIAQELDIDPSFPQSRSGKKRSTKVTKVKRNNELLLN